MPEYDAMRALQEALAAERRATESFERSERLLRKTTIHMWIWIIAAVVAWSGFIAMVLYAS